MQYETFVLQVKRILLFLQHDVVMEKINVSKQKSGISLQMTKIYQVRITDLISLFWR